jgi:hypothetical protein
LLKFARERLVSAANEILTLRRQHDSQPSCTGASRRLIAISSPSTAYIYDWNMLPIGQALWLKELESYIPFPPLQNPASYNLEQVLQQVKDMKTSRGRIALNSLWAFSDGCSSGTKWTSACALHMSAFGGKADMAFCIANVR